MDRVRTLTITADDLGYHPSYDAGIAEAAAAGALDAVSAFATRGQIDPRVRRELEASGVAIGLHLDLPWRGDDLRAGEDERRRAAAEIGTQLDTFERIWGRAPSHLDGHLHCHARPGVGIVVCDAASAAGIPLRSIDNRHRRLLTCRGIATSDHTIGRLAEDEPALPDLDKELREGRTEWITHPGHPDPASGSSYDSGRGEDLELLSGLQLPVDIVRVKPGE